MSRYSRTLEDNRILVWGYDGPLDEYFVQLTKLPHEMKNDNDEYMFSISNVYTLIPHPETPEKTKYTNQEILLLLKPYRNIIPEQHWIAIEGDLPF